MKSSGLEFWLVVLRSLRAAGMASLLLMSSVVTSNASAADAAASGAGGGASTTATASASTDQDPAVSRVVENAVVKVFATMRYPDVSRPWTKEAPTEATGSGVVIEGNRILTNAHVVLYASQIQIQANQEGDKYTATVEAVAPGIDLALLKLEDESFFKAHAPIARADKLPGIKDAVLAYGFPTGGNSLSITKGIVSRIEFVAYNMPVSGLRIQIDAAINPGNSGGPAVAGDKMIGLAFSTLSNTQNIGYIIPNEEIELFLKDVADGHYDGKPALFDEFQTLENPALRSFLKLDSSVHGIIVHQPLPANASNPLREWDIVTQIAGTPVDDQGMINVDADLRVKFQYYVQKVAKDGKVPLTIVRGGKTLQVAAPTLNDLQLMIPDLKGDYPPYFIYGPLVFSKASTLLMAGVGQNAGAMNHLSAAGSPLVTERTKFPDAEHSELVFVSAPLFPHKLSKGYGNPIGSVVYSVNGVRVHDLKQLVALLRDLKDDYVTFEMAQLYNSETLVFARKELVAATEDILSDNGVRAQGSPELMDIWQGKKAAK
jgi:S1-C subfamily serine protease